MLESADKRTRVIDEEVFKAILMDCEEPGEVENKWNSYGQDFLAALLNLSR